jgi:glycosyltransferase involved in cell wall biosynthesis
MMTEWHVITSEYPPQVGGVSDYARLVAAGLAAAGDEVHVWCPSVGDPATSAPESRTEGSAGVFVHRDFGRFAAVDLRRVGKALDRFPTPRHLLVQWVAQGYGYRSINLPFCFWLWRRAKLKHDRVELMVHEPFLAFSEGSRKQDMAAAVHRLMVVVLLQAASQVWVSIPEWETRLRPFLLGQKKSFGWLPVPSNIPVVDDPDGVARVRAQYAFREGPLVGHFGAYDRYMTTLMLELLPSLLNGDEKRSAMLLGKGSLELRDRLIELHPELSRSVHATGVLSAADISRHVSACDVMLQPYPDGVSGRRTSVMTALSHGVPVVTSAGKATENCWAESDAVKLAKAGDVSSMVEAVQCLLADGRVRKLMVTAGARLYRERFDIQQTISALRRPSGEDTLKHSECSA